MTCWCCRAASRRGEWVLINGASSGMGVAVLQMAKGSSVPG